MTSLIPKGPNGPGESRYNADVLPCLVFVFQFALAIELVPSLAKWLLFPVGMILIVAKVDTLAMIASMKSMGCVILIPVLVILVNLSIKSHPELIVLFRVLACWILGLSFLVSAAHSRQEFEEVRNIDNSPTWLEKYATYVSEPPILKVAFTAFVACLFVPYLKDPSLLDRANQVESFLSRIPIVSGFLALIGLGCFCGIVLRSLIAVGVVGGMGIGRLRGRT